MTQKKGHHHLKAEPGFIFTGRGKTGALEYATLGALEPQHTLTTAENLFGRYLGGAEKAILADVNAAGFPDDLSINDRRAFERIAEEYVGTAPDPDDLDNLEAARAFVIAAFAYFDRCAAEADLANHKPRLYNRLLAIGRLLEWWRWRSEKHDAEAVSRQASSAPLKTSTANDDRKFVADEWKAEARAIANRIRERNPRLKSKKAITERVIKELSADDPTFIKSADTVRKVI